MDHPWMQMIYDQVFTVKQYGAWLAQQHAFFQALELKANLGGPLLSQVHHESLNRTSKLEIDLSRLLGANWADEAATLVKESPATQKYLAQLTDDASDEYLLLAHHFLQYNAVLSGGAYLGKMVSEKLCVPHGAPGVCFFAFDGVKPGKEPARVQEYIREFNKLDISAETRERMLETMSRVYADVEEMNKEIYQMHPANGVDYNTAKAAASKKAPPEPLPASELLDLTLQELHGYIGTDGGRIIMSIAGELLDISTGREMYGPGCGYSIFAGRDTTRCLGTMSLEPECLDDLAWEPNDSEEEKMLNQWRAKLKEKYPIAGRLVKGDTQSSDHEGLRQRPTAAGGGVSNKVPASSSSGSAAAASDATQKCPISGKEGVGCPMSMFGIKPAPKETPATSTVSNSKFMAGKSMVAAVESKAATRSLLDLLCPLHWDRQTTRVVTIVAAVAWLSGIFIGWNLRKTIMS
jgi:heme oxygenase